jgi:hypothetical protein
MSMRNLRFAASDDRVFSRVCSGVPSGMRRSWSVGFWWAMWILFGWDGTGNGKRRRRGPWSSSCVDLHVEPSMSPEFMYLCCVLYVFRVMRIQSLCNGEVGRGH